MLLLRVNIPGVSNCGLSQPLSCKRGICIPGFELLFKQRSPDGGLEPRPRTGPRGKGSRGTARSARWRARAARRCWQQPLDTLGFGGGTAPRCSTPTTPLLKILTPPQKRFGGYKEQSRVMWLGFPQPVTAAWFEGEVMKQLRSFDSLEPLAAKSNRQRSSGPPREPGQRRMPRPNPALPRQ